ncbi:GNAT family N-acetyltransferase [Nocardioides sp. GCM10027113]|uniref:GNAT family N-acetyltransferase n=1 Tax=unclassified Nocardioides TaxID=2615069 RepID=UPI00361DCC3F
MTAADRPDDRGAAVLRGATTDDAERLTDLHLDCWDDAYAGLVPADLLAQRRVDRAARVEQWRAILASGRSPLVAEAPDGRGGMRLVGFASSGPARDEDAPAPEELYALYVRAAWWGRGVGHALLTAALGDRAAYLWVLAGNERAVAFYERQGFRADGATVEGPEGRDVRMRRGG